MATFVKQQRQLDPDLLLLNAGNDFIGTEWDRKAGLDAPAAFMNLLAPDAMVSWILLAAELAFCFAL
jgi:2',3'-cyclic-nucleotide 2'-phosphodiesterase (5'-nucleotidase family)